MDIWKRRFEIEENTPQIKSAFTKYSVVNTLRLSIEITLSGLKAGL
jgi:ribosomal protein S10